MKDKDYYTIKIPKPTVDRILKTTFNIIKGILAWFIPIYFVAWYGFERDMNVLGLKVLIFITFALVWTAFILPNPPIEKQ